MNGHSRVKRIVPFFSRKTTKNYLPKIKVLNLARLWNRGKNRKRTSMLKQSGITNNLVYPDFIKLSYVELPSEVRYIMEISGSKNPNFSFLLNKLNHIVHSASMYYPIELNIIIGVMA